jgi:photosystem II stability/assembly factor-like uncharacterized protein
MKEPRIALLSLLIICCLVTVQAWQLQPVAAGENTWTSIGSESSGPYTPQNLAFFPNYATVPKIFAEDKYTIYLGTPSSESSDGWSWVTSFAPTGGSIITLAAAPDNLTVFAALSSGQVYKTEDGGTTWNIASSPGTANAISVSPDYLSDRTVFLADSYGVLRSTDGGANWTRIFPNYSGGLPVEILAISPNYKNDQTIFAVGDSVGINRSQDGGYSWQAMYNLPYMSSVYSLIISPNYATDQTLFAQTSRGLFKSADRAASWVLVNDAVYNKLAISPNYANDGLVICYDQTNPRFLIFNEKMGGAWYADKPQAGPSGSGLNVFAFVPNFADNKTVFAGVTDGGLFSYTALINDPLFSTPPNQPPKANAGSDQTVPINVGVTLNGGGSIVFGGNTLNYQWEIVSSPNYPGYPFPPLANLTTVNPTFTPTDYGDYVVKLVVTDSSGAISLPAYVNISTVRSAPVADAGADQVFTMLNQTVTLDGSKSYDYDNDLSSNEWTIIQKPTASNVTLNGANSAKPTFSPDVYGDYVIQLVVRDSTGAASQDTVTVSCNNLPPVASPQIGLPDPGTVGQTVLVTGRLSSDPNGDPITYRWSFSTIPEKSQVKFRDPTAIDTYFIPDQPGAYVVNLVVNDGLLDSAPVSCNVTIVSIGTVGISKVRDLQNTILGTNFSCFRNENLNLRDALYNKLNAVINSLEANNVKGALAQLQQDLLGKVDGSPTSWLVSGPDQVVFHQRVLDLTAMLESAS